MRYLVLGLLLTCLLCAVAATCLGVRCEYTAPGFPLARNRVLPHSSQQLPFLRRAGVTTTTASALVWFLARSVFRAQ